MAAGRRREVGLHLRAIGTATRRGRAARRVATELRKQKQNGQTEADTQREAFESNSRHRTAQHQRHRDHFLVVVEFCKRVNGDFDEKAKNVANL
jgi:hypothetical protein